MISIQVEGWETFWPDAQAVFPRHWKELALYQDEIPLSIDEKKYADLERLGILLILTARAGGKRMVGYYLWFLMPHPHYATAGPMGMTDMYYVLPEYRCGVGVRLFLESENELRKRGIVKAITSCKVHRDHGEMFKRLGWQHTDQTYCKYLGGAQCQ